MLGHTLVVVSDAHLGATPPLVEATLLSFLETVPDLGDALLINGDLFDFWYSYRRVVPRRGFHVAAALARLARRVPVVMIGGNHDRWGTPFWRIYDGLLLVLAMTHGGNGARIVIGDYVANRTARGLLTILLGAIAVLWILLGLLVVIFFNPDTAPPVGPFS